MRSSLSSVLMGAAFLMATSAIGPGFLTSTAVFTSKLLASFGFAILISIVVDLIAQLNIWRIISVAQMPAQDIANALLPGLGHFLSFLIITGGLVFNIGNVAGCGLGLQVLFGLDVSTGACISAGISILLFLRKDAGAAMDRFAQILGFVMIAMTLFVAFTSQPPLAEAVYKTFVPDRIDIMAIVTIVGGTVGGYITFAGAHRLLEAGLSGPENTPQVDRSAATAIGLASLMRILLFLAALGVVAKGGILDAGNPAASVFQLAAGDWGYRIFGVVLWCAAVTSVVGASFTSISFAQNLHPWFVQRKSYAIIGFIVAATLLFALFGKPVKVLIFAGAFNGFILAFSLGILLIAAGKKRIMGAYTHPRAYLLAGALAALAMLALGGWTLVMELGKLW
ncbi:MAG: divalent metal cation transporter [Saprospiraceae bacterium]|nr:divalent metal cation transporter [Saprospiraceae bacterium]